MNNGDVLMTIDEVADLFGVHRNTINNWRKTLSFPQPLDLPGRLVRFRRSDIEDYLEEMVAPVEVSA